MGKHHDAMVARNLSDDGLFGFLPGDESAGVLLQMELAALPRHGWQHGPAGGFQADMIVRDDQPCHIPDDHKAFDGTARGWI